MGKEILVHRDTLTCTFKGCVVCAYKVLVKPNGDYRQFKLNARPEECLRKVKTDVYSGNVLVVGDGDLTFSLDLSRQSNIQLTATTYLSLEQLIESYGESIKDTIAELHKNNATVLHNVDASSL